MVNREAIGAIGEVAGAIVVVATLSYLAVQIGNQNREARAAAMHEISVGFRENVAAFSDPVMADLFARFNRGDEEFTDAERVQLIACIQRNLRVWEEAFDQYRHGRLDDPVWKAIDRQYVNFLSSRSSRWVWGLRKDFYMDEFREYVDSLDAEEYRIR